LNFDIKAVNSGAEAKRIQIKIDQKLDQGQVGILGTRNSLFNHSIPIRSKTGHGLTGNSRNMV